MRQSSDKTLYILTLLIAIFGIAAAGVGVFYTDGGAAYEVVNQYGQTVRLYGSGIYAHDSCFRAPIFRGTDFTMLFTAVPALILGVVWDMKKKSIRALLFLTSVISIFLYYSASIAFGVTYNALHLVYIALFSTSFFALIVGIASIDKTALEKCLADLLPHKGITTFLIFTGIALIIAWLPDIIPSLVTGRPLAMIEVYTTEATYVIDMGIVAPAAFVCLYLLKSRKGMGLILLSMLLTVCAVMGMMLPVQTVFQAMDGILNPLPVLVTKVGTFCLLAFFAVCFDVQLVKAIGE